MSTGSEAAYLEVKVADEVNRIELGIAGGCSIGRSRQNTLVLADDLVSRNHALIQKTETGEFYLTDLGSANGSLHNGRRVTVPALLHDQDKINIGSCEIVFCNPSLHSAARPVGTSTAAESTKVSMETHLVSVLVGDLRDFTRMAQRIEGVMLSQTLSRFNRQASAILQSYGSWGQKYIGDAVMAVWLHHDRDRVTTELLGILRAILELGDLAASPELLGLPSPLRMGVGVNTGYAQVGNIGSSQFSDYTAIGEVVNRAFRLESATKQINLDIALSPETFEVLHRAGTSAGLFQACQAQLKGYDEPVLTYGISFEKLKDMLGTADRTVVAG